MAASVDAVESALVRAIELGEVGVQAAAYIGSELVLDLCAGTTGGQGPTPVDSSTLFPIFSVTKIVTATALHLQVARGLLTCEEPIATYWPEFAANGKAEITVSQVLTHRAGLPQMPEGVTPELQGDWEWMTSRLAEMEPMFEPGTRSAYHSLSWGWLIGELVRRTDPAGRSFGDFVNDELLSPLGIEDIHLGLDPSQHHRVAWLSSDIPPTDDPLKITVIPLTVDTAPNVYNREDVRQSVMPASGGIANARSVARLLAVLANGGELDGVRLLPTEQVLEFTRPREDPYAVDRVSGTVRWIGMGGYWLGGDSPPAISLFGPGTNVIGHPGAGGSYAWADLDSGLAVAITHNRMFGFEAISSSDHPFIDLAKAIRELV